MIERIHTYIHRLTHTNQYLSFKSNHPSNHKSAVICTLLKWADRLSSSLVDRFEEEQQVMMALMENGYPKHFIRRLRNRHHNPLNSQPEPTAFVVFPYIQGLSDSIKRILALKPLSDLLDIPEADPLPPQGPLTCAVKKWSCLQNFLQGL